MRIIYILLFIIPVTLFAQNGNDNTPFFKHAYDASTGKVMLHVEQLDTEFLYVNSLAGGVGSNDIGLDRGKLNKTRIVKFVKKGNRLLLVQPNQKYRAISDNELEVRAVQQAFATSVIWGFDILSINDKEVIIDITSFLLDDSNGVAKTLKNKKEGTYKLDKSRCVVDGDQLFAFPKNIEFESILTFKGSASGKYLRSVTPSSDAVTVVQHQSFIALPEPGYVPREYHPYSGFNNLSYYDYATPIEDAMQKKFITRHRLEKVNPGKKLSKAKEPIVYYVDSGCPEPVKSALIEGASWWNQAFTAAGFEDAFLVKELPGDVHPLDVRYNVIQWVHRSTRGWSYGASVVDPRTGEIIKGHVSLGSLRVRQDFMIAQGILSPYTGSTEDHTPMKEMALARLRQLSAHEVGHTIGLAHNFAASTNNRASVMDYPHPYVELNEGKIDLSNAYDDKIGIWDKRTITYGYSELDESTEKKDLQAILEKTKDLGLLYMSDRDARPMGSAHPKAHLWDNGNDPIDELKRIMILRDYSLKNFGAHNIRNGIPYSETEKVFVPVYLMHRYQLEAVSKIIGGVDYNYAVKGFEEPINKPISEPVQQVAINNMLNAISPESLATPQSALDVMIPAAQGYQRNRESFESKTSMVFDPLSSAEALTNFVLTLMLHPDRLTRLNQQDIPLSAYFQVIESRIFSAEPGRKDNHLNQLSMIPQKLYVIHLAKLIKNPKVDKQIAGMAQLKLSKVTSLFAKTNSDDWNAHNAYMAGIIENVITKPEQVVLPGIANMPPGSPIGCGGGH